MTKEFSLLVLLFLNIIDTVIPKLTRKDLYFGIRIPSEKRNIKSMEKKLDSELQKQTKKFNIIKKYIFFWS